ncbi:MAG: glycosyltransferase family 2 protein [Candidatus Woesearchaeota archaeon]
MKAYILIPAYNEEKSIGRVIEDLKKEGYKDVLVVDDGSKDDTSKIAKSKGAVVLRHLINRGQGAALQTGMSYLKDKADVVVHFDADGQHDARQIKRFLAKIKKFDVVLGSRFLDDTTKLPFSKRVMFKGALFVSFFMSGLWLSDTHNGFRALNKKALNKIYLKQDDMAHATEILEQIKINKLKYAEVPVTITYSNYSMNKGQSVFNSVKILFKNFYFKFLK